MSGSDPRSPLSVGIGWASRISALGFEFSLPPLAGYACRSCWLGSRSESASLVGMILGFLVGMMHILRLAKDSSKPSLVPWSEELASPLRPIRLISSSDKGPSGHIGKNSIMAEDAHHECPLHHVMDAKTLEFPWGKKGLIVDLPEIHLGLFDLQITRFMVMELVVAVLLAAIIIPLARHVAKNPITRGRFLNAFEVLILFIRDNVARPTIGGHGADAFLPYLWTVFFFVLFNNLLGMIPGGASATGNVNVTAVLAIMTFVVVLIAGIKASRLPVGFWINLVPTLDVPWFMKPPMWLLMFAIEIAGLFIRHLVLSVRLFANMLAGHIVLAVILGFIISVGGNLWYVVAPASIAGVIALSLLELFVAFLQAYIFVFLSALFIGTAADIRRTGATARGSAPTRTRPKPGCPLPRMRIDSREVMTQREATARRSARRLARRGRPGGPHLSPSVKASFWSRGSDEIREVRRLGPWPAIDRLGHGLRPGPHRRRPVPVQRYRHRPRDHRGRPGYRQAHRLCGREHGPPARSGRRHPDGHDHLGRPHRGRGVLRAHRAGFHHPTTVNPTRPRPAGRDSPAPAREFP